MSVKVLRYINKAYPGWMGYDEQMVFLNHAIKAAELHGSQTRRGSSNPYWYHIIDVALILSRHCQDMDLVIAGLYHDVLEDTPYDEQVLRDFGVSETTIALVKAVTKTAGKTSAMMITDILAHEDTRVVLLKYADNESNLQIDYRHLWSGWEKAFLHYAEYRVLLIKELRARNRL